MIEVSKFRPIYNFLNWHFVKCIKLINLLEFPFRNSLLIGKLFFPRSFRQNTLKTKEKCSSRRLEKQVQNFNPHGDLEGNYEKYKLFKFLFGVKETWNIQMFPSYTKTKNKTNQRRKTKHSNFYKNNWCFNENKSWQSTVCHPPAVHETKVWRSGE